MERLTIRNSDGTVSQPTGTTVEEVFYRLAAYEDTGVEPNKVEDYKNNHIAYMTREGMFIARSDLERWIKMGKDRMNEVCKAEEDGRLVVLPCKVGQTVYVAGKSKVVECNIDEAYLDDSKGPEFLVSFRCEFPEEDSDIACRGCPFNNWTQDYSGEWGCDGEWGQASIKGVDFGKTVFLTREEAEAATKGDDV